MNKVTLGLGGGKLWQFSNKSSIQMMSYLIETPDNRLVMIDGGNCCKEDAEFLYNFLKSKGGHIDAWFINHAHNDHFGALLYMLENGMTDLEIDCLYYDFPEDIEWFKRVENGNPYPWVERLYKAIDKSGLKTAKTYTHQVFDFGVKIEVLNSPAGKEHYTSVNDTSVCLLVSFPKRDVLFLGDLAVAGQEDLLAVSRERIRCDIVQMAHHGQQGVNKALYEIVEPKVCLWCAPDWLWDNNSGGGKGSGPWETLVTRSWMDELGATEHYVHAFGDYEFD